MKIRLLPLAALALAASTPAIAQSAPPASSLSAEAPRVTAIFEAWAREQNVPGLTYGIVKDGKLIASGVYGIQDTDRKQPVTLDSRFRIASMSKAFTALAILKLRDEGKLSLDAPAETYVPEMKGWKYPTSDARRITVRDLIHHNAGFVEDNPWGDRQQALSEADFTAMLKAGVPFANAPGVAMEYSNFGYATLGRIVKNVGGTSYQSWITQNILAPLGMRSTDYDVYAVPQGTRALGYRWQDGAWGREPDMADGTFGAMGGMQTTANDYWRWVSFLLSAWPARDGAETGPVKRSTAREIVEGQNYLSSMNRSAAAGPACRQTRAYGMGWFVVDDCDLGRLVTHTGGYPGYGSVVMLLPDAGVGIFAFSNRTYGAPSLPALQSLLALNGAGLLPKRTTPVSAGLAEAYAAAKTAWKAGDATAAPLANNVLLDRDAARRRNDITTLKASVGNCAMTEPVRATSAMEGTFQWACANGKVAGRVQRAPTPTLSLQVLDFRAGQ